MGLGFDVSQEIVLSDTSAVTSVQGLEDFLFDLIGKDGQSWTVLEVL